jgi:hypothetical protein
MPGALSRLIRRLRGSTSHGRLVDLAATEAEQNQVSIANGTAMKKSVQKSQSAIDVTASSTGPLKQQLDLKTVDIKKQKKKEEKQQKKAAKEEKNRFDFLI